MNSAVFQNSLNRVVTAIALAATLCMTSWAASTSVDKTLPPGTRFFVPPPGDGAVQQAVGLLKSGQIRNALLIAGMELTPRAIWLPGDPATAAGVVTDTLRRARAQHAVPAFVLYNIPGRDCGSYSAGGAQNTPAYQAWIDAIAAALGDNKAVIVVEPDGLALLPNECGYDPNIVDIPQAAADRLIQINYAVSAFEARPRAIVYLDAGNSAWHSVGDMAIRLVNGGLPHAQGFFSNSSNYRSNDYEIKFDTWVSKCVAFANNPEEGGWRLGHYDWCASQYFSPLGPVNPNDIATWTYTDQWYDSNMGTAAPTTKFIIDTSRNGQGPFSAASYNNPPYNQPSWVIQTLNSGSWCNPPARGLGARPTANTGTPLLDAFLWVKVPGESDGGCAAQGGARAWDYTLYTQPGWPTDPAGQAVFDPLWGLVDPRAGAWFPQQALGLAQRANPPLLP